MHPIHSSRKPVRTARVGKLGGVALTASLVGFLGFLASAAPTTSAALASVSGGGYSGVLSSNPTIRQQQLICDPTSPISGSTSVKYDPSIVALTGLDFAPGYTGSAQVEVRGQVSVKLSNGCWGTAIKTFLQPLSSFLTCPKGTETGYVQVAYKLVGTAKEMCVDSGFKEVDAAGVDGADTHDLLFKYRSSVSAATTAMYTVYADTGSRPSGNHPDSLTGVTSTGKTFTLGPSQLTPASVHGSLLSGPLTNTGDQENNGNGKGNTKDTGKGDGDGNGHGNANGGNGNSKANRATASLVRASAFGVGGDAGLASPAATAVPLPPAAWSGLAMLAGLGLVGLRRRLARA